MGTDRPRFPARGGLSEIGDLLVFDLESRLHEFVRTADSTLVVVAPFIKAPQLDGLLASVPEGVRVQVTTRWRPEEIANGVSDLEALEVCRRHGAELRLVDRLHAKLFVVDDRDAMLGSANVTARGLGVSTGHNLEVLFACRPSSRSIAMVMAAMALESRVATDRERDLVSIAAAGLVPTRVEDAPIIQHDVPWLPEFRSPDRLHGVYRRLSNGEMEEADGPAMRDLVALRMPFDLDRVSFFESVGARLGDMPAVRRLEDLLSYSRRFGEVSAWIADVRPTADHAHRQRMAQTLIRWLTYFAPARFRMDAPGYSEILTLISDDGRKVGSDG